MATRSRGRAPQRRGETPPETRALEELLAAHPDLAETLGEASRRLLTADGLGLGDRLVSRHGHRLAPVLESAGDLRALVAVLDDAHRAARQCGFQGITPGEDVLVRFARVARNHDRELSSLLSEAPALLDAFRTAPLLAVRLLCLDDPGLRAELGGRAATLEALARSPEDVEALVELLASMARNHHVNGGEALSLLPAVGAALGSRTGAEVFAFVRALCDSGQDLRGIGCDEGKPFLGALAAHAARFRTDLPGRARWVARLMKREPCVAAVAGVIGSEEEAERVERAIETLHVTPMGSGDRVLDARAALPEVFARVAPLVRSVDGFAALCAAMPRIMEDLPGYSEETYVGYTHTYDLNELGRRAENAVDLAEFLAEGPVPDRPALARGRRAPAPKPSPAPPPAPRSPFERFLRQYRKLVGRIEDACTSIEGGTGRLRRGQLFATHGTLLEPALGTDRDLGDLLAVVEDTHAYAPNLAGGVPPGFLRRFVEVKADLTARVEALAAGSPRLLGYLRKETRSAVRLLSLDDQRLLDGVAAHLSRLDPLLEGKRDAPAFVNMAVVLAFYEKVDVAELFGAMEALRAAIDVPGSFHTFVTVRELVTEGVPLRRAAELLPRVRAVSGMVPKDDTFRDGEMARLVRFWRLARFVTPVVVSGIDVHEVRNALIAMADRIRADAYGEAAVYGDELLACWRTGLPGGYDREEDVVAGLEPLFAARAAEVGDRIGLVELCRVMPKLYASSRQGR